VLKIVLAALVRLHMCAGIFMHPTGVKKL